MNSKYFHVLQNIFKLAQANGGEASLLKKQDCHFKLGLSGAFGSRVGQGELSYPEE